MWTWLPLLYTASIKAPTGCNHLYSDTLAMIVLIHYSVILLSFKDYKTTGSFWLCCLFYILPVIIISHYICTRTPLYVFIYVIYHIFVICRNDTIIDMCPCSLLVAMYAVCHWLSVYLLCFMPRYILCKIMDVSVSLLMSCSITKSSFI